ncbi:type ISP restriction/modification enzyme [Microbacterium maritypicum]|nr:type ISP restriction/modification enzyme [Microbacterium liquefaciens]
MTDFAALVEAFGLAARTSLSGPGQAEAALSRPVANLVEGAGQLRGLKATVHEQVSELDQTVRPDFGVRVDGLLVGHIELKAPGISLDPSTYSPKSHNGKQWQRLSKLPNLLHTNGIEWRLWHYGELVQGPVFVGASDLLKLHGPLTAPASLTAMMGSFLEWAPIPITTASRLVEVIAPLAAMLREEVTLAIAAEKRAQRRGVDLDFLPFTGVARDWRALLFPSATDAEFADGFAQTVVFALVLAVSDGIDLSSTSLAKIARSLEKHYSLMGRALDLLTEHIGRTPVRVAVETIVRSLSTTRWTQITAKNSDVYLHLYEHFLGAYDSERRKKSGSYYTPVEIVDSMVRLTDLALKDFLSKPRGFRDSAVTVIDPAMGTGTFPLSILRHVAAEAAAEYGPGAAPEAVSSAVERMYGIEIQSGPFSVAELRISQALLEQDAALPAGGLNLYVADTLEDPNVGSDNELSYTLRLIATQRRKANAIKREKNIQVAIGNPPYKDKSGGAGGWIESGIDERTGKSPLDAFRSADNGQHQRHLNNLYVYFWRWATWKVFESTAGPDVAGGANGVVCFITATGYLTGPGFSGMREYLRRTCSHGWIINVSPEGKQPPAKNAVFGIETPVAIALFVRAEGTTPDTPADIKYATVHGTRSAKFQELQSVALTGDGWLDVHNDWTAPFTPKVTDYWNDLPALPDIMPWYSPGLAPNRPWVSGPSPAALRERVRQVVAEADPKRKAELFHETRDATLKKTKPPLPGPNTEQNTLVAFQDEVWVTDPKLARITYRSFDRQYVVADARLIHDPRRPLWQAQVPGQVYVVEQHSIHPQQGPALYFSPYIPDLNAFNNRGGRTFASLHPDGTENLAPGLKSALETTLGVTVERSDFTYYLAAVTGNAGFVRAFNDELRTPGIRVPITSDSQLWCRAVELGKYIVWLHTWGERGLDTHPEELAADPAAGVSYTTPVGAEMPETMLYDENSRELRVGAGRWTGVEKQVWEFEVGGVRVVDSWFGYRRRTPKGKKSSPLDEIVETTWLPEWSQDLTEILKALSRLTAIGPMQSALLDQILASDVLTKADLVGLGVTWPTQKSDRRPKTVSTDGLF